MSTVPSWSARAGFGRRGSGLTQPAPAPRPRLTLVPSYRRSHAPRAPFILLVVTLLGVGLIALLLLNTALAQGSFRMSDLREQTAQLRDNEEALNKEIADLEAPQRLAEAARQLDMVPSDDPRFLRTPDGKVLGGGGEDR